MAYSLSDDELRKKLEIVGIQAGPVTPTTRRVLEKKLDSILKGQSRTLNTLSSDDSEVEQGSSKSQSKKKRHNHRSSLSSPISHQISNLIHTEKKDVFKKPLPTPPRRLPRMSEGSPLIKRNIREPKASQISRRSLHANRKEISSYGNELSDSDMDTETLLSPTRTLKLRNLSANHVSNDTSDGYLNVFKKKSELSPFLASTPNGEGFSRTCQNVDQKRKDWQVNVPRKSYRFSRSTDSKYSKGYGANGYLLSDPLNGVFPGASKNTGKTTNYWIYVSWFLVFVTVAFFLCVGVFYISAIQKTQIAASRSHLDSFICQKDQIDCVPQKYFKPALAVSRDMHDLLSTVAGEFECQSGRETRNLSFSATRDSLALLFPNHKVDSELSFDKIFEYAILLSLKNPEWGISMFSKNAEPLDNKQLAVGEIRSDSALESKHAAKSVWCRLQQSIQWTLARILLIFFVASICCLTFFGLKYWKKKKDMQEKEFYELVEKTLEVLQTPEDSSASCSSSSLPCKAVVHLRDKILPLKERRFKQGLWDKVVAFIEENESRVQVDYECIGGENFKVWRWLPSPTAEGEEGKKGKVWQGQAFKGLNRGKNHVPFSPTPCLKIRNMFDYEVEYGDDWQVCIKDAILEKCEGNTGIMHIAVDPASKEGCVYVLCDCPESAGKAHGALHGWWFDGKLVTAKFLRQERYLERFPDAEDCEEPLKPSNNKRLSLSTPFFSSALERS